MDLSWRRKCGEWQLTRHGGERGFNFVVLSRMLRKHALGRWRGCERILLEFHQRRPSRAVASRQRSRNSGGRRRLAAEIPDIFIPLSRNENSGMTMGEGIFSHAQERQHEGVWFGGYAGMEDVLEVEILG